MAPSVCLKALSVVDKILVDALVDPSTVSLSIRLVGMSYTEPRLEVIRPRSKSCSSLCLINLWSISLTLLMESPIYLNYLVL